MSRSRRSSGERPYRRLSPLTPLVRSFLLVLAVLTTQWQQALNGNLGPLGWLLIGLLALGAVYGTVSWLCTRYWIEGDELRVDTGVVNRQSRRIRVDRLQGIDIVQPLVARLFGLAELKMDVAGGHGNEGSLAFLPLAEAQQLKEQLLARRESVRESGRRADDEPGSAEDPVPDPPASPVPGTANRVLARLDLGMLLVSLLIAGESFGFLVSAAAFTVLLLLAGAAVGASVLLPIVLGFALVQVRRFSSFYGFTVSDSSSGLQVRSGLFELNAQTIALHRVQGVVVSEPWTWRLLGWARLDVSVAGYGRKARGGDKPSVSTVLPVGRREELEPLARHLLRGLDPDAVPWSPPPRRSRWVAPVRRRVMAAGVGDAVVASRSGLLTRRTHVVPYGRVQSVRLTQRPWQRVLGLATVHVDSPPGPVRVRAQHRDAREARGLLGEVRDRAAAGRGSEPAR